MCVFSTGVRSLIDTGNTRRIGEAQYLLGGWRLGLTGCWAAGGVSVGECKIICHVLKPNGSCQTADTGTGYRAGLSSSHFNCCELTPRGFKTATSHVCINHG